jgi:hypothetical protein
MIVLDKLAIFRSNKAKSGTDVSAVQPTEEDDDSKVNDAGMSTAEYAVGTIAACALATGCRSTTLSRGLPADRFARSFS